MLHQKDILQYLKDNKQHLEEKYRVERIGIFGSYSRGDYNEQSDIDLIVYFKKREGDNLYRIYIALQEEMENVFGKDIDIIANGSISPGFKDIIERETIYV